MSLKTFPKKKTISKFGEVFPQKKKGFVKDFGGGGGGAGNFAKLPKEEKLGVTCRN
jgi:hypothetical protein